MKSFGSNSCYSKAMSDDPNTNVLDFLRTQFDRVHGRFDRIERRLDLVDGPPG